MKFSAEVQKRIDLLLQDCIQVSEKQFVLTEKSKQGVAELQMNLQRPCILFVNLEKKKLQYFRNGKCADYILFENRADSWILHIFELKRTVTGSKWEDEIKGQFRGAMQNALAIAGFLGIPIEMSHTRLYTAYRNDKINDMANPINLRSGLHEKGAKEISARGNCDWNKEKIRIDFLDTACLRHTRIPLDDSGKATASLSAE